MRIPLCLLIQRRRRLHADLLPSPLYHSNEHILLGGHKIRPDTVTFAGYALHLYIAKCLDPDFGDFPDEEIENIDEVGRDQFEILREIVLEVLQNTFLHSDVLSWMLMTDIPPIE